ncbi:TPA: DUF551 domain-containing protein [Klebsiella pneumoniae]|nr:DUF551 domain-containing protein [Klebsiella pneumoniae]
MSEFSRETLINIIETDHVQCGEASALALMALAAMDSEPVAYTEKHEISNMHATGLYLRAWPADRARNAVEGYTIPLYRHAQLAPVVPEEKPIPNTLSMYAVDAVAAIAEVKGWNACRAAMLQAKSLTTINPAPTLVSLPKNAKSLTGNSPVIPEGDVMVPKEPTEAMINAWLSEVANWRGHVAGYKAMLAAAPQPQNAPQNIPEIIPGWIPVSERMPDDEQEVLTINKMGHRFVSFFDKHSGLFFDRLDAPAACCIEHVLVTHWMPLPAAPQEVKSES